MLMFKREVHVIALFSFIASLSFSPNETSSILTTNSTITTKVTDVTTTTPNNQSMSVILQLNNQTTGGQGGNGGEMINIENMTLQDICPQFLLKLEECKCDNPILKELCVFLRIPHQIKNGTFKIPILEICFPTHDKIKGSFMIFASVLGIIGNGLVVIITASNWNNYSSFHKLIGGLALADIIFALFQLVDAIPNLWTCKWYYSRDLCKAIPFIYNFCAWMAIGFILVIAIERFQGIVRPMSRRLSSKAQVCFLAVNFMIGIALTVPMNGHVDVQDSGKCAEVWKEKNQSLIYNWFVMAVGYIIPVIIITCLYSAIVVKLWLSVENKVLNKKQQERRIKDNKRIMAILILVLVCFVVLVFPSQILWILFDHGILTNVSYKTFDGVRVFGLVPYSFHVAVNPLIYSAIDRKFRANLLKLFRRSIEQPSSTTNTTSLSKK